MKKLSLVLPLAAALLCSSCVKSTKESAFKADNTATVKMSMGYKLDAVEAVKGFIEQQMGGEEDGEEGPGAKIDEGLAKIFNEKKIAEDMKKSGVELSKSTMTEKDGYKTVELEGVVKDVNAWVKKAAELEKEAEAMGESMGEDGPDLEKLPIFQSLMMAPKFYKTDKPDVAKVVVIPSLGDKMPEGAFDQLEEMDDDQREQVETFMNMIRGMISLDEMRVEMKTKLPGKILSTKGCKQEGEDTMVFSMKGADIGLDGVKNLFGLKDGVYCTFQFNPQEMKIVLEDEPKPTDSKPAEKKKEEPKPAKKDEEEKKKGGEDG